MTAIAVPDDGPFIDLNMFSAHGQRNWDARVYTGMPGLPAPPGAYWYEAFSTSVIGAAAQYSYRYWDRDFGDGGLYDLSAIHVTGFDVGIYSFRVDGLEVARLDGYSPADINNILTVVGRRVPIGPGPHRISIHIDSTSPLATGLPWYPAIQGMWLNRVGAYQPKMGGSPSGRRGPALFGRTIDLIPLLSTGHTNWNNFLSTTAMMYGYELYSSGAQNAARWWDLSFDAGDWDLEVWCATFSSAGIINVQIDGVTVATIDTYSAGTTYQVKKTARFNVATPGVHRLTFLMATKNGASSQYYGDISGIQLRQVPVRHRAGPWPTYVNRLTLGWSRDQGWPHSGSIVDNGFNYYIEAQSNGAQYSWREWDFTAGVGTYDFELVSTTANNRGIYDVLIDGVRVAQIDGYAGGFAHVRPVVNGIRITSNGRHTLRLAMNSRNVSNVATPGFYGAVTMWGLRRTGP
jgi:hypothetical protein